MATQEFPKQSDFSPVTEHIGQTLLSDGTIIETRIILADLIITAEDPLMGPAVSLNPLIALRAKAPPELRQLVNDKPHVDMATLLLTPEGGFEQVNIEKILKPTISTYLFDKYCLTVTLDVIFVARNNRYKTDSNSPVYNLRWNINVKITKATASK